MDKFTDFEALAKKLADCVPDTVRQASDDLQKTFHSVLTGGFHAMDLVTREQFDTQKAVLARTRQKLEALEKKVAALEASLGPKK